jgi:hypothetical protein
MIKNTLLSNTFIIVILSTLCYSLSAQGIYYADVLSIFSTYNCTGCHGGTSGLNVNSYATLMAGGNTCGSIIPFNADASGLVTKIDPAIPNCSGGNMPQGGGNVSAAHLAAIKQWINGGALQNSSSNCADLSFSAYVEGSNNNKYLEIYNGTGADVNLSGYAIRMYNNGSTTPVATIALSGTLAAGAYYLVANPDANLPGLTPNITASSINFNGNDAIALYNGILNVDVFGQIGINPGDEGWTNGTCFTKEQTWIKIDNTTACPYDNFLGGSDFNIALGTLYTCHPQNDVTLLHSFVPSTADCPIIEAAPGSTNPTDVCSNTTLDLSVVLSGDPAAQVLWYNDGVVIGEGVTLNNLLQNNTCNVQTFDITATAANANPDCTPVSVSFTVNVLPIPDAAATISNPSACEICLLTDCIDFTTYSVNGGTATDGLCYTASAGENSDVVFTISNQCGTQTYSGTVSCGGDPSNALISGFVFIDANNDLAFNTGELTPNGVQVALFDALSSTQLATTTTNFNGEYTFTNLAGGNYYLSFTAPGIVGYPVVGAGSNGLTTPFELAISQNYTLNVGYIIEVGIADMNATNATISIAQIVSQPTLGLVDVVYNSQQTENVLLSLFDLTGKVVYQNELLAQNGTNTAQLNVSNFASGMYILSLQNSHARLTEKLIIK